jgi:transposase
VGIEPNPGPGSGEKLNEETRWRIVFHHTDLHWTNIRIAKKFKCRRNTVTDILEKYYRKKGIHDEDRSGRKRKISDKESKQLAAQAKKGKYIPELAARYTKRTGKEVSYDTVRRAVKRTGKIYLRYHRVDKLTDDHIAARLEYAQDMKDFDYKSVLFTDEKTFTLNFMPQGKWCDPGEHPEKEVSKWPLKLNIWAGVGYYFKTKLYFFEGTMKAADYQACLRARLIKNTLIFSDDCPAKYRKNWYFLQDGATCHTAAKSMDLVRKIVGENIIEHPAMSPDLNVIEDSWSYLVRQVSGSHVSRLDKLKAKLNTLWKNMPWSEIRKSVASMPKRLNKCIELGGLRTGY